MIVTMTVGIGAMDDIKSGSIGIIVTPNHASFLITQKLALCNWTSRMHLHVDTWAKGVILDQEKKSGCRSRSY